MAEIDSQRAANLLESVRYVLLTRPKLAKGLLKYIHRRYGWEDTTVGNIREALHAGFVAIGELDAEQLGILKEQMKDRRGATAPPYATYA